MIYGYVNDEAFHDPSIKMKNLASYDLKHGYLPAEEVTYFVEPFELIDQRSERLNIFGSPIVGEASMLFDAIKSPTELDILTNSSQEVISGIFNIIEFVFFRPALANRNELDAEMVTNPDIYVGYVPDSIQISAKSENVHIFSTVDGAFPILDWIEFSINVNGTDIKFKLWMKNTAFSDNYPLSTICEIVPPLSPEILVDPSSLNGTIEAAVNSAEVSVTKLSAKIMEDGYSNYVSYPTKYVMLDGTMLFIPFNLLYKGAAPKTLEMRQAIKDFLLATNLASEDKWKTILPDLFVEAQFFVLPMWDNYSVRPTRNLFPSVIQLQNVTDRVNKILPDIPITTRQEKLELLETTYSEMFLVTCPDHLNVSQLSIRQEHPTFQRYGPKDPQFSFQEEHTKAFTSYLNRALAVAAGEATDNIFTTNNFNDRVYVSFVVHEIEYHVMTKASYNVVLAEEQ